MSKIIQSVKVISKLVGKSLAQLSLVKGIKWQVASKVSVRILAFFTMVYLGRVLSPNDFALMGVALVVIGLFDLVSEFGLGAAIIQWKELNNKIVDQIFWMAFLTGLLIALICLFSAKLIEGYFNKEGVKSIIMVLSSVIIFNALSIVPFKLLMRDFKFSITAKIELLAKGISLLVVCGLVALGLGVWALVYGQVANSLMKLILSFYVNPYYPKYSLAKGNFFRDDFFPLLKFGINIVGLRFAWFGRNQIDKIIGGRFLSSADFGYYSFAFQLVRNVQDIVHGVLSAISLPILSQCRSDQSKFKQTFLNLIKYSLLIALPIFSIGFLTSHDLLYCLFGTKWLHASSVFKVACIVCLLRILNTNLEEVFIALGIPHFSVIANISGAIFLGFMFYQFSGYGIAGFNLAWITALPIYLIVWLIFTLKKTGIRFVEFFYAVAPVVLAGTILVIAVSFTSYLINFYWTTAYPLKIYIGLGLKILTGGVGYFSGLIIWDTITGQGIVKTILGRQLAKL